MRREGWDEAPELYISANDVQLGCLTELRVASYPQSRQFGIYLWKHIDAPNATTVRISFYECSPSDIVSQASFQSALLLSFYDLLEAFPACFTFSRGSSSTEEPLGLAHSSEGMQLFMELSPRTTWAYTEHVHALAQDATSTLAAITHCRLHLRPLQVNESAREIANRSPPYAFSDTILTLRRALVGTTDLILPDMVHGYLVRLLIPQHDTFLIFPALRTLNVGSGWGKMDLSHAESAARALWGAMKYMSTQRKKAGVPVRRLEMSGVWCPREELTWVWAEMAVECVMMGCVDGYGDKRTLKCTYACFERNSEDLLFCVNIGYQATYRNRHVTLYFHHIQVGLHCVLRTAYICHAIVSQTL